MQRHALGRASEHHHRAGFAQRLFGAARHLQQRTGPEERHQLVPHRQQAAGVGGFHVGAGQAAHHLHNARGHAHGKITSAQHHHLSDGGGQRQHHAEARAVVGVGVGFDAAAQTDHVGPHHVHANAATGQSGHRLGRGQSRRKNQLGHGVVGRLVPLGQQAQTQRPFTNARQVQPTAIVGKGHRHVVAFVREANGDLAFSGFAQRLAASRRFDAVHHAIAQQMLKRGRHAVQHATVHFNGAAFNVQAHRLAGFFGRLPHHPVQPVGNAFELHHAGAQQVALQLPRLAGLGGQAVFGGVHGTLQVALHGGHVVHRLGHHPGEFLHPRETVELQRIEGTIGFFGLRHPRLHLALGLHLDVAQLLTQAVQVVRQVGQRPPQLTQLGLHLGTRDHDLTGLVHQPVEQLGTHPHGGHGRRPHQPSGQAGCGERSIHRQGGLHGCRCNGWCVIAQATHRRGRGGRRWCRGCGLCQRQHVDQRKVFHRRCGPVCHHHRRRFAQFIQALHQRIKAGQQGFDLRRIRHRGAQAFGLGLHAVGHFAQAQSAGQPGTAFEGVEVAQHLAPGGGVVGAGAPLPQGLTQTRQQLLGLFVKNLEQVGVQGVNGVDVVVHRHPVAVQHRVRGFCGGGRGRLRQVNGRQRQRRGIVGGCVQCVR